MQQMRGQAGCGSFFTLITDNWEAMTRRLAKAKQHRTPTSRLAKRSPVGTSGPFLSAEPGYCGAHPPG